MSNLENLAAKMWNFRCIWHSKNRNIWHHDLFDIFMEKFLFPHFKVTVSVISSDPPCKYGNCPIYNDTFISPDSRFKALHVIFPNV